MSYHYNLNIIKKFYYYNNQNNINLSFISNYNISKNPLIINNFNQLINFDILKHDYVIITNNYNIDYKLISYIPILMEYSDDKYYLILSNTCAKYISNYININTTFIEGLNHIIFLYGNLIIYKKISINIDEIKILPFKNISIPLHYSNLIYPNFKPIGWLGYGTKENFKIIKQFIKNIPINYYEFGTYYGLSADYVSNLFNNNNVYLYDYFTNYFTTSKKSDKFDYKSQYYFLYPKLEALNYYFYNKYPSKNINFMIGDINLNYIKKNNKINNNINLIFIDFEKNPKKLLYFIKQLTLKLNNLIIVIDDLNVLDKFHLENFKSFNLELITFNEISLILVDKNIKKKFNLSFIKYKKNPIFNLIYNLYHSSNPDIFNLIINNKIDYYNDVFQFNNSWLHEIAKASHFINIPDNIINLINQSNLKNYLDALPKDYLVYKEPHDISIYQMINWNI